METYVIVDGFCSYEVSNHGNIKSNLTNRILKPQLTGRGRDYLHVSLRRDGKTFQKSVHRLVSIAFIENPENKPTVNHKDGIKSNNFYLNLEWATYKEQEEHCKKLGLKTYDHNKGANHVKARAIIRKDKNGNITSYGSVMDAARELGIKNNGSISIIRCANKKKNYRSAYGYAWSWAN